jgi:subtilisin family serine protease
MMRKIVLTFLFPLFILSVLCCIWTDQTWGINDNSYYIRDELLVQPKTGVPDEKLNEIFRGAGAFVAGEIPQIRVKQIKVPAHTIESVRIALSKNPHFNFVENNFFASASGVPNDSYYASQWHLSKISAPEGWNINTGSNDVPIAIIDSGVDPMHPDLSSKLLQGYNFLGDNTDTHDVLGHGTAVAGSAAALTNNYTGIAGVAWNNPIMPLVVLNSGNYATYSDIASAITYAADKGIKVINISIGGSSSSSTLQNAVNYAWNKGVVIVASAMNNSSSTPYYPAACNDVVAVSATTKDDTLASFSSYGNWVDISAPGVSILTTNNGGSYGSWSGTSFSSPISAGLAALIMSANPSLTNQQAVDIIKNNVDDLGASGFDPSYGWGRINVYRSLLGAVNSAPQPDITPPVTSITYPADGSTISGSITVSVSATDNVGVAKVELYINNLLHASDNAESYNFYWDTNSEPDGIYYLEAIAYDNTVNTGKSNAITVFVSNPKDTIVPVVSITLPLSGSYVAKMQKINIKASDNVGVSKVELYIDGTLRSVVMSQDNLTYVWNTKKEASGKHIISTKAYDAEGNIGGATITVYK